MPMFICPECGESHPTAGYCPVDGSQLAPRQDDLLLGQHIGAYRVARLLGVGGMGRVYKAVHPGIGSRVAIKVLSHDCVQQSELVNRFFAEARAVNLIRHESIVNVLDLATLPDGRPYIIMEYLDGAPLAGVIEKQGALPLGGLARLMHEVLDALSAAHAKGIVHRDLKPDNIFVTPQGRAKVLDFGIAKLMPELSGQAGPTRTGSLLGTPHYMAPEQAMARNVDARTDVYAAGVILFESATGQRPFMGESLFELLHKHINEPPPRPMALRPDMPAVYESVILRAMAKDPMQRFQSAGELAGALAHAAQSLPPQAWAPVTPSGQAGANPLHSVRTPLSGPTPMPGVQPAYASSMASMARGQVQPHTLQGRKSRAKWWIGGLAALVLGGAGIALAVMSTSDNKPDSTTLPSAPGKDTQASLPDLATGFEKLSPEERIAAAQKLAQEATARANQQVEEAMANIQALQTAGGGQNKNPVFVLPGTYVPAGFDPKKFDVSGFMDEARAQARKHYDDAELVRIDAYGVYPSGLADLTLSDSYTVIYHFNSPSRGKRPKDLPLGAKHEPNCKFYVYVYQAGVRPYPVDGWECEEPAIGKPRCTVKEIWKKAIADGAPAENAVAQIGYYNWDGKTRWYVMIGDTYHGMLDDTCK